MERDLIIMIEGGGMLGVFGGGVVTAFHEANIYDRVHSVYGASSGAHDLAYYLAARHDPRQAKLGSSIYFEDLAERQFIRPGRLAAFIWDLIVRRFVPTHRVRHILDLDYLIAVEQNAKRLNVDAVQASGIPFYAAAFDVQEWQITFLDAYQDTMQTLKASSSAPPFYANSVKVRGRQYLDGGLLQNWDVEKIVRAHPDKRIVYVINNRKSPWYTVLSLPYYLLEAFLNLLSFGWRVSWTRLANTFSYETERQLKKFPNVTVVSNTLGLTNGVTDKKKLLDVYAHGLDEGREALHRLGLA